MSDSESVSSASTAAAPTLAELLKEARNFHKKAEGLLKEAAKAAKGVKVAKKKPAGEKKPRKVSEGQLKWQAFQKFVWAELKEENPATPFKEAMKAAGPRWNKGAPADEDDAARFEEWLEENPIPTPEEAMEAREAKLKEEAEEKERKKEERAKEKERKAKEKAKTAKAAPKTPAKPTKPASAAAPKKAAKAAAASDSESEEEKSVKKPTKAAPKAPKKAAAAASDSESEEEAPKKPAAKKLPAASKPAAAPAPAKPTKKPTKAKAEPEEAPADEDSLPTVEIAGTSYMRIGNNAYDSETLKYVGRIADDESSIDFDAPEEK